jgi:NAD(P)-dependent dehydrogenase (short-subunit alcohol dehydrogenase family)
MPTRPVVLVTGANQGIGLQIAREFVAYGHVVLLGSRDLARGQAAAETIGRDAHALQLDVTDGVSIAAAAECVRRDYGRLDILIQNAGISNTRRRPDQAIADYAKTIRPSNVPMAEMRAVWDTNVFGALAVYQAMLPLLRAAPGARIVNVSSGMGSLQSNSDPAYPWRSLFGPVYAASKTALNALTVAMAIELERENIKVNAVSPGPTRTKMNGYTGTETVEEAAREVMRVALFDPDGPTGTFTRWENETIPW